MTCDPVFLAAVVKSFDPTRPAYQYYISPCWPFAEYRAIMAHWHLWQSDAEKGNTRK